MGSSLNKNTIGDNMNLTINLRWLLQIVAGTAIAVYFFWKMEARIVELERNMLVAMNEIELHAEEMKKAEQKHMIDMEERMSWYEQELNLNPFSWGKKRK